MRGILSARRLVPDETERVAVGFAEVDNTLTSGGSLIGNGVPVKVCETGES